MRVQTSQFVQFSEFLVLQLDPVNSLVSKSPLSGTYKHFLVFALDSFTTGYWNSSCFELVVRFL